MQLGMVGLGRMGANLVRRLMRDGHECVVYDVNADAVKRARGRGRDRRRLASRTSSPKLAHAARGVGDGARPATCSDTVDRARAADGAGRHRSSTAATRYYRDDIDRAAQLRAQGIHYVDCGTSGGVFGLERGFCLMIGGEDEPVAQLDPIFETHRARRRAPRRAPPGRTGDGTAPSTATCTAARTAPATS